jgi:hypothetical protein
VGQEWWDICSGLGRGEGVRRGGKKQIFAVGLEWGRRGGAFIIRVKSILSKYLKPGLHTLFTCVCMYILAPSMAPTVIKYVQAYYT